MSKICLTENDLMKMVRNAVSGILRESTDEVKGSIMAEKENEIKALVDAIVKWWEGEKDSLPDDRHEFCLKGVDGSVGVAEEHNIILPKEYGDALGLANNFGIFVTVRNYVFPKRYIGHFGHNERSTTGAYFGGEEYTKYNKSTMKFLNGKIVLFVSAINGELQTKGLYSTLYHELNHAGSTLNVSRKAHAKNYEGLIGKDLTDAGGSQERHGVISQNLNQDNQFIEFANRIQFGEDYERFRAANYLLYALWEITELNARAEEIYGELQHANITEDQFEEFYKNSSLKFNVDQFKELLNVVWDANDNSPVWNYIAYMIHEKSRGRAKKRFISRTNELINKLYKKGMRVAKLYFDRHKAANEPEM